MFLSAVVLAAGSSRRLGRPKQTLPFRGTTLLGATLDVVRAAGVDQALVTLGGASPQVKAAVDLDGFEVVEVEDHGQGCAPSIVAAVGQVDPAADGFVLLLGDQPAVDAGQIRALAEFAAQTEPGPDAVLSRYDDGPGHPLWLSRERFGDLRRLRGDKSVWQLLDSGVLDVGELAVPNRTVPLDVDTWDDYEALCRAATPA
ncbi:MAG TPA: nucleotidyltransferase family protein [Acidimicrobiales bacterium]